MIALLGEFDDDELERPSSDTNRMKPAAELWAEWEADDLVSPAAQAAQKGIPRLAAALKKARREAMDQWRPIKTAPKDGTEILIGWFELRGQDSMTVARWHGSKKRWMATWTLLTDHLAFQPTHWMPRPKPPTGYRPL